jgi:hypothetical protein
VGSAGHHSHLHYDGHHGFLCCIEGTKEVWLYEPNYHVNLIERYVCILLAIHLPILIARSKEIINAASVNPLYPPDTDKWKQVSPLKATLKKGEMLLIPMYELTVSLNISFLGTGGIL